MQRAALLACFLLAAVVLPSNAAGTPSVIVTTVGSVTLTTPTCSATTVTGVAATAVIDTVSGPAADLVAYVKLELPGTVEVTGGGTQASYVTGPPLCITFGVIPISGANLVCTSGALSLNFGVAPGTVLTFSSTSGTCGDSVTPSVDSTAQDGVGTPVSRDRPGIPAAAPLACVGQVQVTDALGGSTPVVGARVGGCTAAPCDPWSSLTALFPTCGLNPNLICCTQVFAVAPTPDVPLVRACLESTFLRIDINGDGVAEVSRPIVVLENRPC